MRGRSGIGGRRVSVRLPLAGIEARVEGRTVVLRKEGRTQASIVPPESVSALLGALATAAERAGAVS